MAEEGKACGATCSTDVQTPDGMDKSEVFSFAEVEIEYAFFSLLVETHGVEEIEEGVGKGSQVLPVVPFIILNTG